MVVMTDGPNRLIARLLHEENWLTDVATVTVIDDPNFTDATLIASNWPHLQVRAWNDLGLTIPELPGNVTVFSDTWASGELYPQSLFAGTDLVIARLPKSLDKLRDLTENFARFANLGAKFIATGMQKHLNRSANGVLEDYLGQVRASLGAFKSRALTGVLLEPYTASQRFPRMVTHPALDFGPQGQVAGFTLVEHGGVFAGSRIDIGAHSLLESLVSYLTTHPDAAEVNPELILDLGCGNGTLSFASTHLFPNARVTATDLSQVALASMRLGGLANGVSDRLHILRTDALDGYAGPKADLILCNPPFHQETTIETDTALRMFTNAATALAPGGALWTVFNSHLKYPPLLRRLVGPTKVVAQNRKFVVCRSFLA